MRKKELERINKAIDELAKTKLTAGRILASQIDVKIGEVEREYNSPFYYGPYKYHEDVCVSLQELIEHILDHCKLSAKYTSPVPRKLMVEKKKDASTSSK